MARVYRVISGLTWALGLVGLVASVGVKFAGSLAERFNVSARGGLICAATLFLCALATGQMERGESASK